jgi:hypothetical protein
MLFLGSCVVNAFISPIPVSVLGESWLLSASTLIQFSRSQFYSFILVVTRLKSLLAATDFVADVVALLPKPFCHCICRLVDGATTLRDGHRMLTSTVSGLVSI